MSRKVNLKLDWCSHEAAKYAVEKWHYSHTMPVGKTAKIGVWEDGVFIGCLIYGLPVGPMAAKSLRLKRTELCELHRVALANHTTAVSRIISISLKMTKSTFSKLRCVVSFADPEQNHHGGIYQAGNWIYIGEGTASLMYEDKLGNRIHSRTANPNNRQFGSKSKDFDLSGLNKVHALPKLKYVMPLDDEMHKQIEPLRQPYPKRVTSIDSDATSNQPVEGGASPTVTL